MSTHYPDGCTIGLPAKDPELGRVSSAARCTDRRWGDGRMRSATLAVPSPVRSRHGTS
jgi:hypothetical protein